MKNFEFFRKSANANCDQDIEHLKQMISEGADVNFKLQENYGDHELLTTPLMAAEYPQVKAFLIESGADVHARNESGQTALMLSQIVNDNFEDFFSGISAPYDYFNGVDAPYSYVQALLIRQPELVSQFSFSGNGDSIVLDSFHVKGFYPLSLNLASSDILINAGANVNDSDNYGFTALMYADYRELIALLLKNGADVNAKSMGGYNAISCSEKHIDSVMLLAEAGCDVNAIQKDGRTRLHISRRLSEHEFLLSQGADVNLSSSRYGPPLIELMNDDDDDFIREELIEILVKAGADVNYIFGIHRKTPLMLVNYLKEAEILLKAGADATILDSDGKTAFEQPHLQENTSENAAIKSALANANLIKTLEKSLEKNGRTYEAPKVDRQRQRL